jgi:hypothetical protein
MNYLTLLFKQRFFILFSQNTFIFNRQKLNVKFNKVLKTFFYDLLTLW